MHLFDYEQYRDLMKFYLKKNRLIRGYQARIAQAIGCQPSYLSLVFKGDAHLTPEQAIALCHFWELGDLETDYFLAIVNLERARTVRLRIRISKEIKKIKMQSMTPQSAPSKLTDDGLDQSRLEASFYSDWHCMMIHNILAIPTFRIPSIIANRLNMSVAAVEAVLHKLLDLGLARRSGDEWQKEDFVPQGIEPVSLTIVPLHIREQAIPRPLVQERVTTTYSRLFTISKAELNSFGTLLRDFAENHVKILEKNEPEELVCLCLDYFVV